MKHSIRILLSAFFCLPILAQAQTTYPARWIEPVNITINPDKSLTKSIVSNAWNAGAASENILPAGQNGFVQFTYIANTTYRYMVSLSTLNNYEDYSYSLYSFYLSQGSIYIYQRSTSLGTFGAAAAGDVFKIARDGTDIKFYRNSILLTTVPVGHNQYDLRADVSIYTGTMPPVSCSFDRKLVLKPIFQYTGHANNEGSIQLELEGGTPPFTYQWSSDEQTSSISGKPRGTYSVTVSDAEGRTAQASYALEYDIGWKNLENVTVNPNNSLTSITSASYGGASSSNTLAANTDGWMEFVVTEPPLMNFMVGLTNIDLNDDSGLRYAFYFNYIGHVQIFESGINRGITASVVKGDVFRIERKDNQIIYYRNGTVIRTIGVTSRPSYMVDTYISSNAGPISPITTSFEKQIQFQATIGLPDTTNVAGSIALAVNGTYGTYATQWSDGELVNTISNKSRGTYTATVTDTLGRSLSRTYQLGYRSYWGNLQGVAVNGDGSLRKTIANGAWNAGAISANRLIAGQEGWLEFVSNRVLFNELFMIGLARHNVDVGFNSIDYCFYVHHSGVVYIYESGAVKATFDRHEGDVYNIARKDGLIKYSINGEVVRTIPTNVSYELRVDCTIWGGKMPLVTTSFPYTSRTFYAVSNGAWTNGAIWSLAEGGAAVQQIPSYGDIVHVKGHKVNVSTGTFCKELRISATNADTGVVIEGAEGVLTVEDRVKIKGDNNADIARALQVKNLGTVKVQR